MALDAPNIFDKKAFVRMRTPSRPYNSRADYARLAAQLKDSLKTYGYLAIAPQNLVEPAALESVIVMPYYDKPIRVFVDPQVVEASGKRWQIEGCANIRLVRDGKKYAPGIKTCRPTKMVISHVVRGKRVTTTYRDRRPQESLNISSVALLCHEIEHTRGQLISDIAWERMVTTNHNLPLMYKRHPGMGRLIRASIDVEAPKALVRDGDRYVLRVMSEFGGTFPLVSPDVVYLDWIGYKDKVMLARTFVPRDGEKLPIVPSDAYMFLYH